MLTKLSILNYILINDLTIQFDKGLNIISGETGAGKSIILSAIAFVLGAKSDKNVVRTGEKFARVEIQFDELDDKTKTVLQTFGIDVDDELIVSRKLCFDGKNDIRVNGQIVTINMLKQITTYLLEIYGQHSYQVLLDESRHIELVDAMIADKLQKPFTELDLLLKTKKQLICELEKYNFDDASREREKQMLEYQINEISQANLVVGEEEDLRKQMTVMKNTKKIVENLNLVSNIINTNENLNVLSMLYNAQRGLSSVLDITKDIDDIYNRIESARIELEDIAETSKQAISKYDFCEHDFVIFEERLDLINALKRKYGTTIEDVLEFCKQAEKRLDVLQNSEQYINEYKQKLDETDKKINGICANITQIRQKEGAVLSQQLIAELDSLGIKNAKFEITFAPAPINNKGADKLTFWFSANVGQKLMPLSKVMSGGEMSRFMLAFDVVFGKNQFGTLIFDEIDAGISGEVSYAVGLKLYNLAQSNQVIAITHLPAICAMADSNFKVAKTVVDEKTITTVEKLNNKQNLIEIARLAGALSKSQIALQNAQELKAVCNQQKLKIATN